MILVVMAMIPYIVATGLFDILNETYISDISELPFSSGTPTVSWQIKGNLKAWIDIVGYRNLSQEGGTNFTFGYPANEAIIQHGTKSILDCTYSKCFVTSITTNITANQQTILLFDWNRVPGSDTKKMLDHIIIQYGYKFDWIKYANITKAWHNETIYISNENNTIYWQLKDNDIVVLDFNSGRNTLQYTYVIENGTKNIYKFDNIIIGKLHTAMYWTEIYNQIAYKHIDEADFYDTDVAPEQFNNGFSHRVIITEYNNTIEPKISIQITNANSSGINISYGNKSAIHSTKSYHVEQTEKGVYYANASNLEAWDIQGQGIARLSGSIIINTNPTFNYSLLNITVSNLYGSVKVEPSQFNISRITYQPEAVFYNPVLFGFLGIFATLTGASYYLIRQVIL